jgi:Flp pilus assembly pilin Flp
MIQETKTWLRSGSNPPARRAPVRRALLRLARDKGGATAIEYAMVASGVGLAVPATVMNLGHFLRAPARPVLSGQAHRGPDAFGIRDSRSSQGRHRRK